MFDSLSLSLFLLLCELCLLYRSMACAGVLHNASLRAKRELDVVGVLRVNVNGDRVPLAA